MRPLPTSVRFLLPISIVSLLGFAYALYLETNHQQASIDAAALHQVEELSHILTTTEDVVGDQVKASMALLQEQGKTLGTSRQAGTIQIGTVQANQIMFGHNGLANNFQLVDAVTRLMGGTATIFSKSGDNFIRISTTLKSETGIRSVGTYLDPQGKAIKALLKGQAFYGVVDILGTPYITGYEPMFDTQGRLIGAWYVGYKADLNAINTIVTQSRFLRTGFQAVLDSRNSVRFHSGHLPDSTVIDLIKKQPSGWTFVYSEIPEWGYKVLTAYPKSEAIQFGLKQIAERFIAGMLFFTVLLALIFRQMRLLVYRPLGGTPDEVVAVVHRIAAGDLDDDERPVIPHSLLAELSRMRSSLRSMIQTITENAQEIKLASGVIKSSHNSIVVLDIEGTIVDINPAFTMLTGYSREDVLGKNIQVLRSDAEDAVLYADILRHLSIETGWSGELQSRRKNGAIYIESMTLTAIQAPNGEVSHYVAISTDISNRVAMETSLRENERFLNFILETSPIALRIARPGGREILFANPRYDELLNISTKDQAGIDPKWHYVHPEEYDAIVGQLADGGQIFNKMIELKVQGQSNVWVMASYLPVAYKGEQVELGWLYDITARKLAEDQLKLAARVFSEAHEGIVITDIHGNIVDANPAFTVITGYSRDEVIGRSTNILNSGKHGADFFTEMWQAMSTSGYWQGELWNRKKSGDLYAEHLAISALYDGDNHILQYIGMFTDITETKHHQETLALMAHYDPLTQLPNRILFADRFNQALARARRDSSMLGVCYLDLDGFKAINDSLGHDAGDRLLIQVAERIKSMLREEDTISRLGGDEFALLLCDLQNSAQCEQTLSRVHGAIAEPYLINERKITISASTGFTLYPSDHSDQDALLRHADQAMYQAKNDGRNRFHLFDATHEKNLQEHRQTLIEIEQALLQEQFRLYYQPKVVMTTGEVLGAEALIRWLHPQRGLVPPLEFLPYIEGTYLEISIGNWVIEQALGQLSMWRENGLDLEVSVNISSRHLQQKEFLGYLADALAKYPDIPSHRLQLEVLESSVFGDLATISQIIRTCSEQLGVSIALDDFGTGYSSLTHLRHLPVNLIKIDQSFVRDMIDDPGDYAIVKGVIGLASAFHREVIAEGVETRDHGLLLLSMGCHIAQGYGIARPMPAEALNDWIKNYHADYRWQDFAKIPPKRNHAQIMLLQVKVDRWISAIEQYCYPGNEAPTSLAVEHYAKSHFAQWVKLAVREQKIDSSLLVKLTVELQLLHRDGSRLIEALQAGEAGQMLDSIESLRFKQASITELLNLNQSRRRNAS